MRRAQSILCILVCLVLSLACASGPQRRIPPITEAPTGVVRPGQFVTIDLVTRDMNEAQRFYGALFGWTFRPGDRYVQVFHEGRAIAGIIPARAVGQRSEWIGSVSVRDVDATAARFVEHGGTIERSPREVPDRGRMALVSDREGALILLLRSASGDPPDDAPPLGGWMWRELWTQDIDDTLAFYRELGGYRVEKVDLDGLPYYALFDGDTPRAGIVESLPDVPPLWLPYVRVDDTKRVADEAAALGARVVMQHERSAILVDPTGAAFAVQVRDEDRGEKKEAGR